MAFVFTWQEILDMILMTAAAGFIFMDMFKRPASHDPLQAYKQRSSWTSRFWYSAAIVAPSILLHELGHKFVALGEGLTATFHAAYVWLAAGVLLKLVSFPFLIIVPAYVSIIGSATPLQSSAIAFGGPGVNLLLYLVSFVVLRTKRMGEGATRFWLYMRFINGFLFIFNMLPIPGFDGFTVYQGLWQTFA